MLIESKAADAYALDEGLTRTFIKEAGGGDCPATPQLAGAWSRCARLPKKWIKKTPFRDL
jgi:hypothetical protein